MSSFRFAVTAHEPLNFGSSNNSKYRFRLIFILNKELRNTPGLSYFVSLLFIQYPRPGLVLVNVFVS